MFATLSTAWVLPGVIGPAIAGVVAEQLGWRLVFLGLLPLIAIAGVADACPRSGAVAGTRRAPTASTAPRSTRAGGCRWRSCSSLGAGLLVTGLSSVEPALLVALVRSASRSGPAGVRAG